MQKADKLVGIAFFSLILIGVPALALWDFHHPDKWEREFENNPRIYLPVMAFSWCVSLYTVMLIALDQQRKRRRARLVTLLIRAEELVRQQRRREAMAVLQECQALYDKLKA